MYQLILNMLVIKYLANDAFDHIYPWDKTLSSIAWEMRASYHCTIQATSVRSVFFRDMTFNLASVID